MKGYRYSRIRLRRSTLPALFFLLAALLTAAASRADEEPILFTADSGEETTAFAGHLQVPEYRGDPGSQAITLRYVRFPTTSDNPGPPLVYLAGGPGGSGIGTAKWRRFPLFMAMRAYGDVIALDQRGTGDSHTPPRCESSVRVPTEQPLSDAEFAELHRRAVRECAAFWQEAGVDLRGYTTVESVHDLSALREHLGAEQIRLWGISYGSHLALAAMKLIPEQIERVVVASVEGLDQTVKLPARSDDYFARLGVATGTPELPAIMRRVHSRLEAEATRITLSGEDGEVPYLLQRRDFQQLASAMIADPAWAKRLIQLYQSADRGDYAPLEAMLSRYLRPKEPITLRAMPTAMDRASGISSDRLQRVREQAAIGLLGDYLNFPMPQIVGELTWLDLGDDYRREVVSDIPTLVLTGSLDGRTYPQGQQEAIRGLSRATQIVIDGAGHNLFVSTPEITTIMGEFLSGATVSATRITAVAPEAP